MIYRNTWQFLSMTLVFVVLKGMAIGETYPFPYKDAPSITSTPKKMKTELSIVGSYRMIIGWNEGRIGNKPLLLNCDFQNNSSKPVWIDHCNFGPNHEIILKDENGVEPKLTERGAFLKEGFKNGGVRDRNIPVLVQPGHSDRETITLDRYYDLKPGKYRLKVRFREWARIPGVTPKNETFVIDIVSNDLEFVISHAD